VDAFFSGQNKSLAKSVKEHGRLLGEALLSDIRAAEAHTQISGEILLSPNFR